jgi:hypothetical protein
LLRIIKDSKEAAEDTRIELGERQSYFAAIGCELIAVRVGNAPDDPLVSEAS